MSFIGAQPDRTAYTGGGIYKASEQLAMYQSQMFPDAFYEPISSQTLIRHTNKRTGSINNVDIRSFTFTDLNSYDVYYWNISGLKTSNDFNTDAYLRVHFSETNGDSFLTGNYQYNRYYLHSNSTLDADSRSSSNVMIPTCGNAFYTVPTVSIINTSSRQHHLQFTSTTSTSTVHVCNTVLHHPHCTIGAYHRQISYTVQRE